MGMLFKISLRNLLRQKRRNILLGIGIAFGMSILILSNAFSHGLSDILLNKIIKWMTGHVMVTMTEKQEEREWSIIRDNERFTEIIDTHIEGDKEVFEGVSSQTSNAGQHTHTARALGNGTAEFIVVVGITLDEDFTKEVKVVAGDPEAVNDPGYENPIMLYDKMAEKLNVGLNDTIRARFSTAYGQVQAAKFTVVALLQATNPFMSVASFTSLETLKPLVALEAQESQSLSIIMNDLDDPQIVVEQAQRLHEALQPGAAGFLGMLQNVNGDEKTAQVLAVQPELSVHQAFAESMTLSSGDLKEFWENRELAVLSQQMAQSLGLALGDSISLSYDTKFHGMSEAKPFRIAAIFQADDMFDENMVFLHQQELYESSIPILPKFPPSLSEEHGLFPLLLKEWTLLEMTDDRDSYEKKHKALDDSEWKGRVVEVNTMYELASDVLQMEKVLDMITFIAVMVLFSIILIGVINTLRMTIRERTREIGTVRAIGMQRSDVRWSFVLEVMLLAFFAGLVGLGVGFLAMKLLSMPTIESDSMLTMFLLDQHVHFLPTVMDAVFNMLIILFFAFLTSFFPAWSASRKSVAGALRHFE